MIDRTLLNARRLDRKRIRGLGGATLALLFAQGKGTFTLRLEVTDGWFVEQEERNDIRTRESTPYVLLEIAETADPERNLSLKAAIMGEGAARPATDFAVRKGVYKILPAFTERPLGEPRRWLLRGYLTEMEWPA